jgi:ADP-ribose pyrophosphatase
VSDSFRVIATTPLLESRVFRVEQRVVEHDGTTFERDVAVHPGAVSILAINDRDEVGLLRQYRAPFDDYVLEIPAGTMDVENEEPLDTAKRELLEELGCEAQQWRLLGRFKVSPGWTTQVMTMYEARGITMRERHPAGPEERSMQLIWVPFDKLKETLRGESSNDYSLVVALHRVFGTLFDDV